MVRFDIFTSVSGVMIICFILLCLINYISNFFQIMFPRFIEGIRGCASAYVYDLRIVI